MIKETFKLFGIVLSFLSLIIVYAYVTTLGIEKYGWGLGIASLLLATFIISLCTVWDSRKSKGGEIK